MTKLKYGRLYMNKSDILEAMKLPKDTHLELIGANGIDGAFEFKVIANGDVEHECLTSIGEYGIESIQRVKIPFDYNKGSWTMTDKQLEQSQKFADLLLTYNKMDISPDVAIEIIKNSVE